MKKIFHHDIRLRIGRNDCRNIINLIVHRRINRNGGSTETEYTAKPNTIMKLDLGIVTDRSQEDFMSVLFGNQQKQTVLTTSLKL